MKESQNTASKAERLKDILKGFGIRTNKDLDEALSGALGDWNPDTSRLTGHAQKPEAFNNFKGWKGKCQ